MGIFESASNFNVLYCSVEISDYSMKSAFQIHIFESQPKHVVKMKCVFLSVGRQGFTLPFGISLIDITQLRVNDFHLSPWLITWKHTYLINQQIKASQRKQTGNPLLFFKKNIFRASDCLYMKRTWVAWSRRPGRLRWRSPGHKGWNTDSWEIWWYMQTERVQHTNSFLFIMYVHGEGAAIYMYLLLSRHWYRGQPGGTGSFISVCESKRSNSGLQTWLQEPLPAEPTYLCHKVTLYKRKWLW